MSQTTDHQADDNIMYVCASDGSLALTGRELRERNSSPREAVTPESTAGRVLHAWEITDERGDPVYREYTTTHGYLVSDSEVITDSRAFAEVDIDTPLVTGDDIRAAVREARQETSHNGLKRRYSEETLAVLEENATQIEGALSFLEMTASSFFAGVWEDTFPYLVGRDHTYHVPLKGENSVGDFRDIFMNQVTDIEMFSSDHARVLWQAVDPQLTVHLDLYIDGELVT